MSTAARDFAPLAKEDVPQLAALMAQAFPQAYGEAWSAAQLGDVLNLSHVGGETVRVGGALAGFSLYRRVGEEAELLLVAVLPLLRGQGLGRQLLLRVAAAVRIGGAQTLFLEVRDGNNAAQQLYSQTGFVPVGRRQAYYRGADGRPHDAVTMRLDLTK